MSTCQSVSGHMDEPDQIDAETTRLISELLTRVGMMMEDASTVALLRDSCGGNVLTRVTVLDEEIARMKSISEAAKALLNG